MSLNGYAIIYLPVKGDLEYFQVSFTPHIKKLPKNILVYIFEFLHENASSMYVKI